MSELNIYQISNEYLELSRKLIESEGELTPELEAELAINSEQLEAKSRGYGYVIKKIEDEELIIESEIKRLSALLKSRSTAKTRLKSILLNAMELFSIEKIETPTLKISLRKSTSVDVPDVDLLDEWFKVSKVTISANKVEIKKAIEEGKNVIGATLVTKNNLQIK